VIRFLQLTPGEDARDVQAAIDRVVTRGWFILGPEVDAFEQEFATASGASYGIGVGTGTDALALALRALGIGPGDEVITSPLSAAFSALAIMMVGARPVFADIDPDRLTIDPDAIAAAVTPSTAAIMPVHLYGQAADMPAILRVAERHNLAIVEDCCQAHLATCGGKPVGSFGPLAAFSFYPTKNLGALGDAGAVVTDDAAIADELRRLLSRKLAHLDAWNARRRELAAYYLQELADAPVTLPAVVDEAGRVWHVFVVLAEDREAFRASLLDRGVETLIHYPEPIHRQPAYTSLAGELPLTVSEHVCARVVSLPLYAELTDAEAEQVVEAVLFNL
jgi:dTDP-4-amino-4,6-dideoxygalactose transaminase